MAQHFIKKNTYVEKPNLWIALSWWPLSWSICQGRERAESEVEKIVWGEKGWPFTGSWLAPQRVENANHMKLARQFEACNFSKETITQTFFCINAFQVSISIDLAIHIPTSRLCQSKDALHPAYLSWRDHFIKYKETTRTKTDTKSSNVGNGWYSREDMSKVLKWNKTLSCIQVKTQCPTHVFLQSYVVDVGIQNTTS